MTVLTPNLVVSNITVPASVDWTDTFALSFTIKNLGPDNAQATSVASYAFDVAPAYPGNLGTTVSVPTIIGGLSSTFTVVVDSLGLLPGEHTVWVAADILGNLAETDETNNLASATFTVGPAVAKPDLLVAPGTLVADSLVATNGVLNFSYALENAGTGDAGSSLTLFKID